jgi:hypothetical protein
MKKLILLFGILAYMPIGWTNPIPDPYVKIREFVFTSDTSWQIELEFWYCHPFNVDSIYFQSNNGITKLSGYTSEFDVIFITSINMVDPVYVDPAGDVIGIICFMDINLWEEPLTNGIRFGNVSYPFIYAPSSGQSISGFDDTWYLNIIGWLFTLDDQPTPGQYNADTIGTCGTMSGTIYDMNGNPVTEMWFRFDQNFKTNIDGTYTTSIFSRIFSWNKIVYYKDNFPKPQNMKVLSIDTITFGMVPDSSIYRDIHLLDTLEVGLPEYAAERSAIMNIFPNPVESDLIVSFSAGLSGFNSLLRLAVVDMQGKEMASFIPSGRQGVNRFPLNLSPGIYMAVLFSDDRPLESKRFIIR